MDAEFVMKKSSATGLYFIIYSTWMGINTAMVFLKYSIWMGKLQSNVGQSPRHVITQKWLMTRNTGSKYLFLKVKFMFK